MLCRIEFAPKYLTPTLTYVYLKFKYFWDLMARTRFRNRTEIYIRYMEAITVHSFCLRNLATS